MGYLAVKLKRLPSHFFSWHKLPQIARLACVLAYALSRSYRRAIMDFCASSAHSLRVHFICDPMAMTTADLRSLQALPQGLRDCADQCEDLAADLIDNAPLDVQLQAWKDLVFSQSELLEEMTKMLFRVLGNFAQEQPPTA
jgi:hypothetical protein